MRTPLTAGVLNYELADWADSAAREGRGRFSYVSQNTVVGGITFVGACQTASHVRVYIWVMMEVCVWGGGCGPKN